MDAFARPHNNKKKSQNKQVRKFKASFTCQVELAYPEATLSDQFKLVQFFGICLEIDTSDRCYYDMYVQLKRPLRTVQILSAISALHKSIDADNIKLDTFTAPPPDMCVCMGFFRARGRQKKDAIDDEYELMEQDVTVMTTCSLRRTVTALREKIAERDVQIEALYEQTLVLEELLDNSSSTT
jgi:hypothetical protein